MFFVVGGIVVKTRFGDFHYLSDGRTDIPVCPGWIAKGLR
jgi:hypothetical protein